ncbi:MAG: hypothetical protein IID03_12545 [Candidatus Dadabacteria bacterium]|nr:hypothetical protein [Candidatus Dadabacteria bacterium]
MTDLIKCPKCSKVPVIKTSWYGVHTRWKFTCCEVVDILGDNDRDEAIEYANFKIEMREEKDAQ